MQDFFYYRTIWEHITAFSELFNNMSIYVYDKSKESPTYGKPIGRKIVPIILAPKEKVISVLNQLVGSEKAEIDNILPKISITWTAIEYDKDRTRGKNQKRELFVEYTTQNAINEIDGIPPLSVDIPVRVKNYDIQTVPYKLTFEMVIWTKYMDDGVQLLENILPFFAPDRQISLKERGVGIEREAKVTLTSVTNNFTYNLNEPDRRILQWNLSFTCECNLYRPIYFDKEILNAIIRVSAIDPKKSQGESIIISAQGANMQELTPIIIQRIQEIDQLTSSTASVSGNMNFINIDTWANPQVSFTPLTTLGNNFISLSTEDQEIIISEDGESFIGSENSANPINPDAGILTINLPEFNDAHNPPVRFDHPVSRHISADYYNKLNIENPVTPDPDADEEYQAWLDDNSPGGG